METFFQQFDWFGLLNLLSRIVSVLLCLTIHETSHGLAAFALGDSTAKQMHRLSLNPLHHIDWLGLASMLICGFGWAKPVPVDMRYFKKPKTGMALTALAGPVSNFILALLMIFLASLLPQAFSETPLTWWLFSFLLNTAILSIGLGLFNLIPIPPLDGSKIFFSLLPEKTYYTIMRYERFGMVILLLLVGFNVGSNYLSDAIFAVYDWMTKLFFR